MGHVIPAAPITSRSPVFRLPPSEHPRSSVRSIDREISVEIVRPCGADPSRLLTRPALRPLPPGGYSRARFVIEQRRARCFVRPAARDAMAPLSPLPNAKHFAVFEFEPHEVTLRTHVLCVCPACNDVERGQCATCMGSGRVEAWIALESSRRVEVTLSGGSEALQRRADVREPADFDAEEWEHDLVHRAYYRSLPPQLSYTLHPQLQRTERVVAAEVQTFVERRASVLAKTG